MIVNHSSGKCKSADIVLSYRLFGNEQAINGNEKTPVLFIHGLSYFSYDWLEFGVQLCIDRLGCAMDMRGFGDSSESAEDDYSIPSMAEDIKNLLDHLGWEQVILVAHSMGARSAAYFTQNNPDYVKGLVLVDWSPENAPAGSKRVATTVANMPDVFADLKDVMKYFGTDSDSPDGQDKLERFKAYTKLADSGDGITIKRSGFFKQQFIKQLESGKAPNRGVDLWGVVRAIQVPVLLLRGTRSDLFAAETLPKMLDSNNRIQAQEIEAGHYIIGDNPEKSLSSISTFIQSLETK